MHRPLRVADEEIYDVATSDGKQVRLTRLRAGDKGPVVLAPGYGTSTLAWTIDTVETNFPEFLNEAIAKVREVSGADTVQAVPHCMGSMSFMMAMAAGLEGVRSAVCSQLGLHPIPVVMNRARAKMRMATLMHGAGVERLSATFHEDAIEDRALEAVMKHVPAKQRCDSPVCHRIQFIYGDVYDHAHLNDQTHDSIVHIFGKTRMTAFKHIQRMIRKGHAVDANGKEAYMPHLDRVNIPITFLHGEHNRMFLPRSTELTYQALRDANGDELYERKTISGYAHMDCWIGKNAARDVFPIALDELERFN